MFYTSEAGYVRNAVAEKVLCPQKILSYVPVAV